MHYNLSDKIVYTTLFDFPLFIQILPFPNFSLYCCSISGKIEVTGVEEILGHKVFVLRFLQCRDEDWIGRPFFAKYDPKAVWYDDLEPLPGMELPWDENGIPKPVKPRLN